MLKEKEKKMSQKELATWNAEKAEMVEKDGNIPPFLSSVIVII